MTDRYYQSDMRGMEEQQEPEKGHQLNRLERLLTYLTCILVYLLTSPGFGMNRAKLGASVHWISVHLFCMCKARTWRNKESRLFPVMNHTDWSIGRELLDNPVRFDAVGTKQSTF